MTRDSTGAHSDKRDRPLRIIHLLPCLYLGGAEQHVLRLIRAMSPPDQFSLVAPDGPGSVLFDREGVPRRPFRRLELDAQTGFSSVRRALAEEAALAPIDIVHVHIESGLLWFAKKVLPGVPRVFTAHGIVGSGAALKYWLTTRAVNRWADLVCVVSEHDMHRFLEAGCRSEKLRLISSGAPPSEKSLHGSSRLAARLGLDRAGHTVIGSLSRLETEKGIDTLIRAVAELKGRFPEIRLVVAGSGGQESRLRHLIDMLDCGNEVALPGYVSEPGDFLSCLDIYVQPSRSEAFGLGVNEAMAAGLPVIASKVGGLPEQVVDGETGYLVPPDNVALLADRIARLAKDAKQRRSMGKAGQMRHKDRFGPDRFQQSMRSIYLELSKNGGTLDQPVG